MDTNLVTIPAEMLTRLAQMQQPAGNSTVRIVEMIILALPALGTFIIAIKTAGTVGKIETSTNSAASAMTAELKGSREAILRMSQELATMKAEHTGQLLAAATAVVPTNVRDIIREEIKDKRNV